MDKGDRKQNHSQTKSTKRRHKPDLSLKKVRAAISNKSYFLPDVDLRGPWARRFRDVIVVHEDDLGGSEQLSEAQRALVRRISMLQLYCEILETRIAQDDFKVSRVRIESYQRVTNTMRRAIESLGLHEGRKSRDITPGSAQDKTHEIIEGILGGTSNAS